MTDLRTPAAGGPRYAELHAHSAFSFLDGASQPEELAAEAARLGLSALALTDHDGLYGVVRFAQAARAVGLPTVFGAELHLPVPGRTGDVLDPPTGIPDPRSTHLLVLARGAQGYRNLSRAIATAHLDTGRKGAAAYTLEGLAEQADGQWLVLTGCRKGAVRRALEGGGLDALDAGAAGPAGPAGGAGGLAAARTELDRLVALFGRDNVAVEVTDVGNPWDSERCDALAELAASARLPLVATGAVHYATPRDADLAGALAAVRARSSLEDLDGWLPATAGAHLRSAREMLVRHARHPQAVATAAALGAECAFDLALVAPNLPPYPVPPGHTEASWLREITRQGARRRYGPPEAERVPGAYAQIAHELDVIEELDFPGYFLIVHDLVDFCRRSGILCQGRGSAANSAVCYALGVTAVDAVRHGLLFERFLAPERDGPPDIDVDIESDRREEVIQYVYAKHGRTHAAQVANVISYRPKSAVRDAARALGYDVGQQDAWSKSIEQWGSLRDASPAPVLPEDVGADRHDVVPAHRPASAEAMAEIPDPVLDLAERFLRLPRHLGIHSGGMVMCDRPVIEVCPVEWATMPGRTVLQWDKDDCADAGLVKFDLLGLGMLSALGCAFTLVREHEGLALDLHELPQEDPHVYDLLCAADTVGVFQVESRAQMGTLPRLKPRRFYDIVVEVALIRPGPIQGGSVHPYIARYQGREKVTYLHPLLEKSLSKTLGVPLFQEQLMQMAIDVADFTGAEADQLRRAMGSKRSTAKMEALHARLLDGMARKGISREIGEQIFDKLKAFADFGFPESHAYSFAYLVYASTWLKAHHPAAFYAGLLAAQPMGFYSPQSLVADARRHGITVLRPDVQASGVLAGLERVPGTVGPVLPLAPLEGGTTLRAARSPEALRSLAGAGAGDDGAVRPDDGGTRRDDGGTRRDDGGARPDDGGALAVRLGLASVRGIGDDVAAALVEERSRGGPFTDLRDLARRVRLTTPQLEALATGGALGGIPGPDGRGVDRREALWAAGALAQEGPDTLPGVSVGVAAPTLPGMSDVELAVADVWATGVSADSYPTEYVREGLDAAGVLRVAQAFAHEPGRRVAVAGVVTHRQRPGTAGGVTFLSLEDETGLLNVVCTAGLWRRFRRVARTSAAMVVRGQVERADGATNLIAEHLAPLSLRVPTRSRDFH